MAGVSAEDLFRNINFEDVFGGFGFNFDFGGGLFERFFGGRRRAGPARGRDLEIALSVPLERIASGGEEPVTVMRLQRCTACAGSGARSGTQPRPCKDCGGSGRKVNTRRDKSVTLQQISTCTACGGRGSIIDEPCAECAGSGQVERAETLKVRIPAGVEEGVALRVAGHGMMSDAPGGIAGDLFVVVRSAPDARFERDGAQLWRSEIVALTDAVLGTTLKVPTLKGADELTVPAGTQPGTVLRLRGEGLPAFGSRKRGDLLVRVQVQVPEKLGAEERRLFERLRQLQREPPRT